MQSVSSGRERLLLAAADLFIRKGFGPVGLDQIIDAVGVTKTTFYKHFESKDELILAVLAHQHQVEADEMRRQIEAAEPDDPKAQILSLFDVLDGWFRDPQFHGCIFLRAATEFPDPRDPIHKAALVHGERLGDMVREKAIAARADRELAATAAAHFMLLVTGAVMSRMISGDLEAARKARQAAELLLRHELVRS